MFVALELKEVIMIYFHMGTPGTLLMAVLLLVLGRWVQSHIRVLEKYFIPPPVIGGFIVSIVLSCLAYFRIIELEFDAFLQQMLMIAFFTTVGFTASLKFLKKGGKFVVLFLFCATGLLILQNIVAILLAWIMGKDTSFGMALGSITMTGGHGTAAAFAPLLEGKFGLQNATVNQRPKLTP